jgi:hypothetical protein
MHEVIQWMGAHFSPQQYLFWTRIQSCAWTSADLVLIFYLLRCANLMRRVLTRRLHRYSYWVLAITACIFPGLFLVENGMQIFLLELLITVPHFLLILYVIGVNYRDFPHALVLFLGEDELEAGK